MLEALYASSGRDCGTTTGLWQEFCQELGASFRDTDYEQLHEAVCAAMDATDSVMTDRLAHAAIAACRAQLLGRWQ